MQVNQHLHKADERADHAESRSIKAQALKHSDGNAVPPLHGRDFKMQHGLDDLGGGVVGDKLTGLFKHVVFGFDVLKSEDAFAAGKLRQTDHGFHHVLGPGFPAPKGSPGAANSLNNLLQGKSDEGGGRGAANHYHDAGQVIKGAARAVDKNSDEHQPETADYPEKSRKIHNFPRRLPNTPNRLVIMTYIG